MNTTTSTATGTGPYPVERSPLGDYGVRNTHTGAWLPAADRRDAAETARLHNQRVTREAQQRAA